MKEKIAVLFMSTLAAVGLPTCSDSSGTSDTRAVGSKAEGASTEARAPSSEDGELVMTRWGNQVRNERTQAILDLYSERNPGVTFDRQPSEQADYWNKLATATAGHPTPDVVQMDYKYTSQYVDNDLLVDLAPYIENGTTNVSDCNEDMLNSGKVGDGLYVAYNGINAPALLHSKTTLDEAGIMVKNSMTMGGFITLCKKIREKAGYKVSIAYNNGENFIKHFLQANGVVMFGEKKLDGAVEDYISHFKLYEEEIRDSQVVDPSISAKRTIGSVEQNPMVYGSNPRTMFWRAFNYTNQLITVRSIASGGVETGITTRPLPDPVRSDYLKPSQFFAIIKDSVNPDRAAKVLDFITNSVECNSILLGERGTPLSASVVDAISPNMDETSRKVIKFISEVASENLSQTNPPSADGSSEVNDPLDKPEESACYGQMTAEDTGQQLSTEGSKVMESEEN